MYIKWELQMANQSLNKAKIEKNDEFYTLMSDIENELSRYDFSQFKDKIVYCNCDDPTWSNFFKFFTKWGKRMGISEVHFTNYANTKRKWNKQLTLFEALDLKESAEDDRCGTAHHWTFYPETNQITKRNLKGNGDFRSLECIEILRKCDIVVTNPPFSIFNDFLNLLIKYDKSYLIISDDNKLSNIDIFPLIKANKLWLGYTRVKKFLQPDGTYKTFGNKCWYTNLEVTYRRQPVILHDQDLTRFKKYDNYNAIEIPEVKYIPDSYYEPIGLPITFLHKFCPEQFEIIGMSGVDIKIKGGRFYVAGRRLQPRLVVQRRKI